MKAKITVSVQGKGDVQDALDNALNLVVVREPGCCPKCTWNEDPYALPQHAHCRCTVAFEES